ncbi:MAG TPA: class I adenylate-forming enzyme family protein, partial [Terriglobales bacterium]|nr:class I adenylate-forming enzyme family protein [Terriglobales bacterium]
MNLFSILENSSWPWAGDAAVVHGTCRLSYSELFGAARRFASKLCSAGVESGDKVGLFCPNSPAYVIASLAILHREAILVTAPPGLQAGDVFNLTEQMKLDAIITSDSLRTLVPDGYGRSASEVALTGQGEGLHIFCARARMTPVSERRALEALHAATVRFSSGTLSEAKGIVVSHATYLARLNGYDSALPPFKEDKILWLQPIATVLEGLYIYLLRGATIVLGHAVDAAHLTRLVAEHGITQVYAPPLFYRMMLNEKNIAPGDLAGIRYFMSTGSALPGGVGQAFHERFGREIVECYGLAECGRVLVNFVEAAHKRGSVGKPALGYEVTLMPHPAVPHAQDRGELCVRGPGLFDAYYKPWRLRESVLEGGWFKTGDLARRDEDGTYWITGRIKEVINVGGLKVFPAEIEALLLRHPEVDEALVYGVPDARFG